ncbi:metabotropic glutamate receptor 7-like isoform X3 [Apostichopus japonicus]|uniref:metabotropic glutamate receptor 7-like isoform X3 n=1 Tax=Stichopus japonicus TaxID=307972 RepID=UPI003AB231BC
MSREDLHKSSAYEMMIPQVSYASTSSELSDKSRYGYFLRVVPPDTYQAQAMMAVVKEFGWTYVSTVASAGNYGEKGIEAFKNLTRDTDVCLATSEVIGRDSVDADYDQIVEYLNETAARGVVVFASEHDTERLLAAVQRANLVGRFNWVGSDDWGNKYTPVENYKEVAEGAITLSHSADQDNGFKEYFLSLDPYNHITDTRWFKEYWEATFKCKFSASHSRIGRSMNDTEAKQQQGICNGTESLSKETFRHEGKVPFVIDAVYAFAHALHLMHSNVCNGIRGLCSAMQNIDGSELLQYLNRTTFEGKSGSVRFNRDGDRPGSYQLYQYRKSSDSTFEYVPVGTWDDQLVINKSLLHWGKFNDKLPGSICVAPCEAGLITQMLHTDRCCWICIRCQPYQILQDEFTCANCSKYKMPSKDKSTCVDIDDEYLRWNEAFSIIPAALSVVGIFFTMFTIIVFIKYQNTPVIRASGRELCYVLLSGILLTFVSPVVILAPPSDIICGLRRIMLGIPLVISYSALFTKTNRVYRIFNSGKRSVKRPQYTSPRSQIVICLLLVSVQVFVTVAWLLIHPPAVTREKAEWNRVIIDCSASDLAEVTSLVYAMFLVLLCTVYAFKTRKMPENFNEAKFIAFTMYTTCIVWTAFIPIVVGTASTDYKIQQCLLCLSVIVSASVTLCCIFVPKLYIVLLAPHKNRKQPGVVLNSRMQKSMGGSMDSKTNNGDVRLARPIPSIGPTSYTASSDVDMKEEGSSDFDEDDFTRRPPDHDILRALNSMDSTRV